MHSTMLWGQGMITYSRHYAFKKNGDIDSTILNKSAIKFKF